MINQREEQKPRETTGLINQYVRAQEKKQCCDSIESNAMANSHQFSRNVFIY